MNHKTNIILPEIWIRFLFVRYRPSWFCPWHQASSSLWVQLKHFVCYYSRNESFRIKSENKRFVCWERLLPHSFAVHLEVNTFKLELKIITDALPEFILISYTLSKPQQENRENSTLEIKLMMNSPTFMINRSTFEAIYVQIVFIYPSFQPSCFPLLLFQCS